MATNPSVPSQPAQSPQFSQTPPLAQEPAPLSEGQRLADVFFAPSKTFTDLRRSASWWAPFLISALVSLAFVYVADQKIGFRKIAENTLHTQPKQADQVDRLPAAQRETNMQQRTVVTKWISYGFFTFILIWSLVVAGVLLATLKFGLSADVKFKTIFALVIYAGLPGVLKAILAIFSILAGAASDGFTFQNPIATNPGYFVDPAAHSVLYSFLTSFDIFSIWTMVLVSIGITCISKVKIGTAFAVVFGWFAFIVLAGLGIAVAFS
jgi:Yip1 domain